ncbi:alpha-1,3-arabinosyltransferase XAT3-like [Salvia miltiorrhiza]|uniref:alpha-1,3-arabinosyltransferase XAT3-like n=1 Tax=Salvia miltiorrhiza TaxID=226208 RepID=UPI0025AD9AB8|nr:alpha-1,3-arabinosyltransferase XAT3-like [Salvia miltiorrhiza]
MEGDIRVEAKSSTIVIVTPLDSVYSSTIEPYPRPKSRRVKKWRLTTHQHNVPRCTQHHNHPAILFSISGFTGSKTQRGNYFHDFADVLFPLYMTSSRFQGEVHFLATDYKPLWIRQYTHILNKLTKHNILDIDAQTSQVHCYHNMQLGLTFYNVLMSPPSSPLSPPSPSMHTFRQLLRETYSLKRESATILNVAKPRARPADYLVVSPPRPRLMIIDRKQYRVIRNAGQVSSMAAGMGFEVVVADAGRSTEMWRVAEAVNSCDVLVGVHGAGLTNMVFLPDKAVVIQILPFGDVEWYAATDFGNPAPGMNLRYMEYKISRSESSLTGDYPTDHHVLTNPESYRGTPDFWTIYMIGQNVTLDLTRFKGTLVKALELLRPSP